MDSDAPTPTGLAVWTLDSTRAFSLTKIVTCWGKKKGYARAGRASFPYCPTYLPPPLAGCLLYPDWLSVYYAADHGSAALPATVAFSPLDPRGAA